MSARQSAAAAELTATVRQADGWLNGVPRGKVGSGGGCRAIFYVPLSKCIGECVGFAMGPVKDLM